MAETSGVKTFEVGKQGVRFEPPDLFVIQYRGDVTKEELVGTGEAFATAPGPFYAIIDVSDLKSITSEAKRAVRNVPLTSGLAIVGASRQMQLMLSLMNKVYMMVNFGKNNPITFVSSQEEAFRWVADVRRAAAAAR